MIKIEELPNFNLEVLSSEVMVSKLREVKQDLEEHKVVSKHTVISLEEFIGMPIITAGRNINSFSSAPTAIGLTEVIECVDAAIAVTNTKGSGSDQHTINDILEMINKCVIKLDYLASRMRTIKSIDKNMINRMLNEKYIYSYKNERNEDSNEVIDVTYTLPVFEVFRYRNDYLTAILATSDDDARTSMNKFNNIKDIVETCVTKEEDDIWIENLILISVLLNKGLFSYYDGSKVIVPGVFSIREFIKLYENTDEVLEQIAELRNSLTWKLSDMKYMLMYNGPLAAKKEFHKHKHLYDMLEHKASNKILELLSELA